VKRSKKKQKRAFSIKELDGVEIPTRKISETLLDFAEPLCETVPDDITPKQLEQFLITPITIWNSVVLEELGDMPGAVARARAHVMIGGTPFMLALFDSLVERKRRHFADDYRLIGRHRVRRAPDGSLKVQAEAHWRGRPAVSKDTQS
jgi:hypothetical protein